MANNGSFNTTGYDPRYLTFEWSVASQNVAHNQTTINWKIRGNGPNAHMFYMSGNFKVVIEGSTVYQSETRIQLTASTTVATGQFTITHNSDGNKRFSASVEAGIYYFAVNSRGSGSWDLPMIARASTPSINKTTVTYGDVVTINTPRASSQFTHTIQVGVDNHLNFMTIASNVGTSYQWRINKDFARYLPTSSQSVRIKVITYSGSTYIGEKEVPSLLRLSPTSDMAPSVTITLSDEANLFNTYGGFVKGQSRIRAKVTERLYQQTTVSSRTLNLNSISYQTNDQTSEVISTLNQVVTATVTDARGMVGVANVKPVVHDWYVPKVTTLTGIRVNQNGTVNEAGQYIQFTYGVDVASVNNKNTKTLTYGYKKQTDKNYTTKTVAMTGFTKNESVIIPASGDYSWDIYVEIRDAFTSTRVQTTVGTVFVLLDFHHSGKGIGIGKVSEKPLQFELAANWDLKYKNEIMADFIIEQGTKNNWFYRKWYSGVLECFISGTLETVNQNQYRSKSFTLPFVQPHNNYRVHVTPTLMGQYAQYIWVGNTNGTHSKTTSQFTVCVWHDNKTNITFGVDISVIGRWKN